MHPPYLIKYNTNLHETLTMVYSKTKITFWPKGGRTQWLVLLLKKTFYLSKKYPL